MSKNLSMDSLGILFRDTFQNILQKLSEKHLKSFFFLGIITDASEGVSLVVAEFFFKYIHRLFQEHFRKFFNYFIKGFPWEFYLKFPKKKLFWKFHKGFPEKFLQVYLKEVLWKFLQGFFPEFFEFSLDTPPEIFVSSEDIFTNSFWKSFKEMC